MEIDKLVTSFREGDPRALARLLTLVEDRHPAIHDMLDSIYPDTGNAWRIGFTGPPGAGKSTLVNRITQEYRKKDLSVGIVAFDPTSPFTGGALLGDRVRMTSIGLDPEVFIRSVATRGHMGGLAVGVDEACDLMDAFGKQRVLIETVGVGQSELEVAHSADTTIVVLVPQSGDAIQAMKAGLMEIADVFVMNKCDREDADRAYRELVSVLSMKESDQGWHPPVLKTVAENGEGVVELVETVRSHRDHLVEKGLLEERNRARIAEKIRRLVEDDFARRFWKGERKERHLMGLNGTRSPYKLAQELIEDFHREIRNEKP